MAMTTAPFRISAATGLHRGDRADQQDQVELMPHPRTPGSVLGLVADGMGGKSGGRKAADQVLLTARQLYERFSPPEDDPGDMLQQLVTESHIMIKLTAIATEEEPHSTIAAFHLGPDMRAHVIHVGDSRVYHFRGPELARRTADHSVVQRLVDNGSLSEDAARSHPQSNLLTGCLGTRTDPPITPWSVGRLEFGDTLLACSDGLWHSLKPDEMGAIVHALPPRQASEMLIRRARQRSRGGGDNLSLALARVERLG
jgi:serine/threonine protein phosphatase PrpC